MKIISGFSLVEAVVMIVVFSIIFMTFQAFFSHGVRSTMKGQDTLQAIRESSIIFSQLEKDFLASNQIDAGAAILSLDISTQDLPPIGDPQYGNMLSLGSRNATVTYSLEGASEKYILRRMIKGNLPYQE
ncbi:hypothetical protein HYY75_04025 [bacterium]|nr:hypothetical protein [bacterium]